jgi:hypothetical protein
MAGSFDYRQARELGEALRRLSVRYLFIGKSGAILLGYPDTTEDADIFVEKNPENDRKLVEALKALGYELEPEHLKDITGGKDFIQLRYGPFDLNIFHAPDGIESFADAAERSLEVEGLRVCHIDDIIRSKEAAGRARDREALARLKAFRDWWVEQKRRRPT